MIVLILDDVEDTDVRSGDVRSVDVVDKLDTSLLNGA